MRVLYTVEFAIDVDAKTRPMALHEAGTQWPVLDEQLRGRASDVTIKKIAVAGGTKAEGDGEDSE